MSKYNKVIVFGATGDVGSAAALQAHRECATVSLAMRNLSKPTPQLDGLHFKRYEADLTQPNTLKTAVRQSGSNAAFIYGIFDGPDFMRPALRALKEAGNDHVAGTILVNGANEHIVRLLGPETMTLRDAVKIVGNVLGKEVRVTQISRKKAAAQMEAAGVPTRMVNWHLHNVIDRAGSYIGSPDAPTARNNILRYTQHPPQRSEQWVEDNKARFRC